MQRHLSLPRTLLALAALLSPLLFLGASPTSAQEEPQQVVIFVIDLSGSMNEAFGGGQTKLDVAKEAFEEAFERVSPDAMVGLRVYGDQFSATSPENREENCTQDSQLLVPIDQVDRDGLIDVVRGFTATGDTPIGLALREADGDIPDGSVGTIVLFSDGRDECFDADLDGDPAVGPSWGEDPCVVAADIAGDGVDLKIEKVETVGFGADSAAELELRCIADVSGGSYTDIKTPQDAKDLLPALLATIGSPRIAERLGGLPIEGTLSRDGAPSFVRLDAGSGDGRYVDSIEMNTEKWYRLEEFGPDGGTFTATVFGLPAQDGIELSLRAYLPETDQTFFESRIDRDAGLPRRPTASVRCPGCFVSGGPHDIYWIVSLTTDNPALGGVYDVELLTEGAGFGGPDSNCREPQECWYEGELALKQTTLEGLQTTYDELAVDSVATDLLDERSQLADDVATAEDALDTTSSQLTDLQAQNLEDRSAPNSFTLPAILGALGLAGLLGSFFIKKKAADPSMAMAGVAAPAAPDAGVAAVPDAPTPAAPSAPTPPGAPASPTPPGPASPLAADTAPPGVPSPPGPVAPQVADTEPPKVDAPKADAPEAPKAPEAPGTSEPSDAPAPAAASGQSSASGIDKGWYPDPSDPTQYRWWDGTEWTNHTQEMDK